MDRIPAETLDGILDFVLEDKGPTKPADCTTPLDSDPFLESLRTLRLVCKTFRDAVADRFWSFYANYSILLDRNSLKKLKRIAQNKHTRSRLRVLWIFTHQLRQGLTEWPKFKQAFKEERAHERKTYLNFKVEGQDELPFTGTKIMKAYQAYKQLYEQQEKMKVSGERRASLSEIFELLDGHVSAINICGGWCGPPFRPITEKIGISHFHDIDDQNNGPDRTRAVCDIVHSIYWSRIRLCGLNWLGADSNLLDLPDPTLRYLRKSRTGNCQFHDIKLSLASDAVEEGYSSIHKIFQACPHVETLELKFPNFSEHLVDIRYLFGTKHYERLAHLHVSGFTTKAEDLAKLLYRHRDTLKCIELCDIILERGCWASLFKFMHDHLKIEVIGINQLFQPGITLVCCHNAVDITDYVLRKTDTMDWPAFQEKNLHKTPNRLFAVQRLTEMLGIAAAYQSMVLEPAFWLNDDQLTSDGPPELTIKNDEDEDFDWEVEQGFITDPESDDDEDEDIAESDSEDGKTSEKDDSSDSGKHASDPDAEDSDGWETDGAFEGGSDAGSDANPTAAIQPEISRAQARFAEFSLAAMHELQVTGTGAANSVLLALAVFGQDADEEGEDDDMDDEDDSMPPLVDVD